MNLGYLIIFLLVLVYGATALFLFLRARQQGPGQEEAERVAQEEPEEVP